MPDASFENPTIVLGGGDPVIEPLAVTENGTTTAPSGVDGFNPITVNVAGQTPYEERSLTIASAMSSKEIAEAFNYTVKYKESIVIVQAFGDVPVTTNYCIPCYMMRQKNGNVAGGIDYYSPGAAQIQDRNPNTVMQNINNFEKVSNTKITNRLYVNTTSSQMGGIGCVVKLYEIPIGITTMPYNLEEYNVL